MKKRKVKTDKMLYWALLLIGLVMLIEGAATLFVVTGAPQLAESSVALGYAILKALVGIFAIIVGLGKK